MLQTRTIAGMDWIHAENPALAELQPLIERYDLHELIVEDLTELNTQDKIDSYDDHLSIILHFPKFDTPSQRYLLNEISIVLGKDWLLTATRFPTNTIEATRRVVKDELASAELDKEEQFKITPYYIMYLVIENLYDKSIRMLTKITRDLIHVEEAILNTNPDKKMIKSLMIKKRNISFLRYTFQNQEELLEQLTKELPKFYEDELSVYFEDLATKHQKIMGMIQMAQENVDSMADTYDTLMTINTNDTILILTVFTGIMLPMTLITGIFGMNVPFPFATDNFSFWSICIFMILLAVVAFVWFKIRKTG